MDDDSLRAAGFLYIVDSLQFTGFLDGFDSLSCNGFLSRVDSLCPVGFLHSDDSLSAGGFLDLYDSLGYATLWCIPNLALLYSSATGKPSKVRHAVYKSTRNRLTV